MSKRPLKPDISIVLPTFNEQNNVRPMLAEIEVAFATTDLTYEVIFVDDSSDATPDIIASLQKSKPEVRLVHRPEAERTGLGTAIFRGINEAKSNIVCSMDSDLQHPPETIPKMYKRMVAENKNFTVASRMVAEGSSEGLANGYRHLVSRMARLVAWTLLPLTKKTTDPMTGFFMLDKRILKDVELNPIGFKLLVEILARVPEADVVDVPFVMRRREFDDSKATLKEGFRYINHLTTLILETETNPLHKFGLMVARVTAVAPYLLGLAIVLVMFVWMYQAIDSTSVTILVTISTILTIQGLYALFLMLYAWEDPETALASRSPEEYKQPKYSFTTLLPVRHETKVVFDTLKAISAMDYPRAMCEIKVICSDEDIETIAAVEDAIADLGISDIASLVIYDHRAGTNKPKAMNAALVEATYDVVVVFDAEDEPHPEIFNVVNTVMLRDDADVVQSGVQLMNYRSNWFSMFNVMEYYFWFKSSLHFYAKMGVIPLGGNTVFFKREKLQEVNGWDDTCLTEDGDIGLRLSNIGARIQVVYDEQHTTHEETPPTVLSLIKQRTRWSQGFLQILLKGEWLQLPKMHQKLLAFYVFSWPVISAIMFLYVPVAVYIAFTIKIPTIFAIVAIAPVYILVLHFTIFNIGLFQFTRDYRLYYPLWLPLRALIFYYPYQLVLGLGAFRAMVRLMVGNVTWEKTEHVNAHRQGEGVPEPVVVSVSQEVNKN